MPSGSFKVSDFGLTGTQTCNAEADATSQSRTFAKLQKKLATASVFTAMAVGLSGCGGAAVGALTLAEISSITGIASTFMTGKDLPEHALSMATGKDCRILESILRADRELCEENNSEATQEDFQGVFALMDQDPTIMANALVNAEVQRMVDPSLHGFSPVDRTRLASDFRVDTPKASVKAAQAERKQPMSFGLLHASYGQSWSYEGTALRESEDAQPTVTAEASAEADPTEIMAYAPTPLPTRRSDGQLIVPDQPINR